MVKEKCSVLQICTLRLLVLQI